MAAVKTLFVVLMLVLAVVGPTVARVFLLDDGVKERGSDDSSSTNSTPSSTTTQDLQSETPHITESTTLTFLSEEKPILAMLIRPSEIRLNTTVFHVPQNTPHTVNSEHYDTIPSPPDSSVANSHVGNVTLPQTLESFQTPGDSSIFGSDIYPLTIIPPHFGFDPLSEETLVADDVDNGDDSGDDTEYYDDDSDIFDEESDVAEHGRASSRSLEVPLVYSDANFPYGDVNIRRSHTPLAVVPPMKGKNNLTQMEISRSHISEEYYESSSEEKGSIKRLKKIPFSHQYIVDEEDHEHHPIKKPEDNAVKPLYEIQLQSDLSSSHQKTKKRPHKRRKTSSKGKHKKGRRRRKRPRPNEHSHKYKYDPHDFKNSLNLKVLVNPNEHKEPHERKYGETAEDSHHGKKKRRPHLTSSEEEDDSEVLASDHVRDYVHGSGRKEPPHRYRGALHDRPRHPSPSSSEEVYSSRRPSGSFKDGGKDHHHQHYQHHHHEHSSHTHRPNKHETPLSPHRRPPETNRNKGERPHSYSGSKRPDNYGSASSQQSNVPRKHPTPNGKTRVHQYAHKRPDRGNPRPYYDSVDPIQGESDAPLPAQELPYHKGKGHTEPSYEYKVPALTYGPPKVKGHHGYPPSKPLKAGYPGRVHSAKPVTLSLSKLSLQYTTPKNLAHEITIPVTISPSKGYQSTVRPISGVGYSGDLGDSYFPQDAIDYHSDFGDEKHIQHNFKAPFSDFSSHHEHREEIPVYEEPVEHDVFPHGSKHTKNTNFRRPGAGQSPFEGQSFDDEDSRLNLSPGPPYSDDEDIEGSITKLPSGTRHHHKHHLPESEATSAGDDYRPPRPSKDNGPAATKTKSETPKTTGDSYRDSAPSYDSQPIPNLNQENGGVIKVPLSPNGEKHLNIPTHYMMHPQAGLGGQIDTAHSIATNHVPKSTPNSGLPAEGMSPPSSIPSPYEHFQPNFAYPPPPSTAYGVPHWPQYGVQPAPSRPITAYGPNPNPYSYENPYLHYYPKVGGVRVYTYTNANKAGHFKWGVRHNAGLPYSPYGR